MRVSGFLMLGAALVLAAPGFSSTYYGGFEDLIGGDYDYNDLIFSISGSGLALNTQVGNWYPELPSGSLVSNASSIPGPGSPFWNHNSWDGPEMNIGWCIWGGGNCGAGLSPGATYLATSTGGAVNDVYFSDAGNAPVTVTLPNGISAYTDVLGWEPVGGGTFTAFGSTGTGPITFDPNGSFILVAEANGNPNAQFFSNSAAIDGDSHFAFFDDPPPLDPPDPPTPFTPTPEPTLSGLLGVALIGGGFLFRKKIKIK